MAVTSIRDMVIVPDKFASYVADRTTEKNTFVNSGIATPDATVGALINGTPKGGRFIEMPMWNALTGKPDVFGEGAVSVERLTTKSARATLMIWQKAWGDTDLAHVLGGADPMGAIASLMADWRNGCEQGIYTSILKGVFGKALKDHLNDISGKDGEAACISDAATLDTKQLLGDHYESLGMVFMHSAVYTDLQKRGMITRKPVFDPSKSPVEMSEYLGYDIRIDDGMPWTGYAKGTSDATGAIAVTDANLEYINKHSTETFVVGDYAILGAPVYDTYFVGKGAFIRQEGLPQGLVAVETDRDKFTATDYLINRWCQIIAPRGFSWTNEGNYIDENNYYPDYADLEVADNWKLVVDHKKASMACLRHKIVG